jgi:hypothetical protein
MAFEQLSFPDPAAETAAQPAAPRISRRAPVAEPVLPRPAQSSAAPGEVVVEHRYPEALAFVREHGPHALAVLYVLAVDAELVDGRLAVRASTRGVAERLGFLSKDSAHRRLRQLRRAGVIEAVPPTAGPLDAPTYVLHLHGTGISVTQPDQSR